MKLTKAEERIIKRFESITPITSNNALTVYEQEEFIICEIRKAYRKGKKDGTIILGQDDFTGKPKDFIEQVNRLVGIK